MFQRWKRFNRLNRCSFSATREEGLRFNGLKFKVCDACALRWMVERFNVSNLALILILFLGFFLAPQTKVGETGASCLRQVDSRGVQTMPKHYILLYDSS